MLFNSAAYLLLFLPLAVVVYFLLNRRRLTLAGQAWLVAASLFFYGYWKLTFLPIILVSILVNYVVGVYLSKNGGAEAVAAQPGALNRRAVLVTGLLFNIGLLGYFKYADFFVQNVNALAGDIIPLPHVTLPIGISFFTFQQIAYLVDSYRGQTKEYDFLNYCLFVTFFPQLIAGPIVHHKDMMPQFAQIRNKLPNWKNIYVGLFFLASGLFKKVAVADTFGAYVARGFSSPGSLTFTAAWATSLCYTAQLYFDFSGYTDMAIGAARLMNIRIAQNFEAPYRALDIQDFWRRWHITLGNFLRDYIYIPLGGNRKGRGRTYVNLFLTFLIGGLWHGAGWTYVLWGALHGAAICVQQFWKGVGLRLPKWCAWLVTALFVNGAWVVFRADSFAAALGIWRAMLGMGERIPGVRVVTLSILWRAGQFDIWLLCVVLLFVLQDLAFRTTQAWAARIRPNMAWTICTAVMLFFGFALVNQHRFTEFIYFQF